MKIAIQADGGSEIGMGHIMRTLVLAKELSKENEVFYICRVDKANINFNDNTSFQMNSLNQVDKHIDFNSKYRNGIEKIISDGFSVELVKENNLLESIKNIPACAARLSR